MINLLEEHSRQLSHLFHTKADLSAVDAILNKDQSEILAADLMELRQSTKEALVNKVTREDLERLKAELEKEVNRGRTATAPEKGESAVARVHYKCLACDSMLLRLVTPSTVGSTTFLSNSTKEGLSIGKVDASASINLADIPIRHLAPNIAFRRWQMYCA
jgi:hypothetical protein